VPAAPVDMQAFLPRELERTAIKSSIESAGSAVRELCPLQTRDGFGKGLKIQSHRTVVRGTSR